MIEKPLAAEDYKILSGRKRWMGRPYGWKSVTIKILPLAVLLFIVAFFIPLESGKNAADALGIELVVLTSTFIFLAVSFFVLFQYRNHDSDYIGGKKLCFSSHIISKEKGIDDYYSILYLNDNFLGTNTLKVTQDVMRSLIIGNKYHFEVAPKSRLVLKMEEIK
jgi:hypothetical protein